MRVYLIAILLFSFSTNAQLTSIKLFYNYEYLGLSSLEKENSNEAVMRKAVNRMVNDMRLELWYCEDKAIFFKKNQLIIEKDKVFQAVLNFAEALISKGTYYTDLTTNQQFIQNAVQDKKFLFSKELNKQNWKLTNESKYIQNFLCYKAIWMKEISGKPTEIVAWYTSEIPLKLGPKEYIGSLPGAILELTEPLGIYRCSYVEIIKEKTLNIKWPKDLETAMSEQEYHQKGKEFYNAITH